LEQAGIIAISIGAGWDIAISIGAGWDIAISFVTS
jgi:hypothetical protein